MAKTYEQYTGDGVRTVYPADFVLGYFEKSDIYVYQGTDHTVQLNYVWQNDTTIELSAPITSGETMRIRRVVDRSQTINNYTDGAVLNEEQLDASFTQALMIAEEIDDGFLGTGLNSLADDLDAGTHSIHNVADAVDPQDVPSFNQLTTVNTEAAASAAAALASADAAVLSQTSATDSATAASNAAVSANDASTAAMAAESAAGVSATEAAASVVQANDVVVAGTTTLNGVVTTGTATINSAVSAGEATLQTYVTQGLNTKDDIDVVAAQVAADVSGITVEFLVDGSFYDLGSVSDPTNLFPSNLGGLT